MTYGFCGTSCFLPAGMGAKRLGGSDDYPGRLAHPPDEARVGGASPHAVNARVGGLQAPCTHLRWVRITWITWIT